VIGKYARKQEHQRNFQSTTVTLTSSTISLKTLNAETPKTSVIFAVKTNMEICISREEISATKCVIIFQRKTLQMETGFGMKISYKEKRNKTIIHHHPPLPLRRLQVPPHHRPLQSSQVQVHLQNLNYE